MISYIGEILMQNNILLDIVFHAELESLPDTYLQDVLGGKLEIAIPGKIISNEQVDIDMSYVDISSIKRHLRYHPVEDHSPMVNHLIGRKPIDNKGFTCAYYATFYR